MKKMSPAKEPVTVIRPSRGWMSVNFRELWDYRELLYFLTWRDIKVRYKQTVLGATWAVLQPVLAMIIFTLFFGRLAHMSSDGIPYPIFTFCALLVWQIFTRALTDASTSLVVNERLITKVYFPRLIVPASAVLASLLDFAIGFVILIGMVFYYGIVPSWTVMALPLFIFFTVLAAMGIGFLLSALDVQYRDVRYTLSFLTQIWFFATPIVYSSTLVPEKWRPVYGLNPMAGLVEGFRWSLFGGGRNVESVIWVSVVTVLFLFFGGVWFFRRMERTFADTI